MRIYFIGFLANTDSSILNVKLDHNFEIESMKENEGKELISILDNIKSREASKKLGMDFSCLNTSERKLYVVRNSFEDKFEIDVEKRVAPFPPMFEEFHNDFVSDYLNSKIRLLRLFKEGNICMPLKYYYIMNDTDTPKRFYRESTSLYLSSEPRYKLEDSDISDLQRFIQKKIPFKEPFLQLSFENFELSYNTHSMSLSFLSLMISLETLFNPGNSELKYRISRNAAVLLGNDKYPSDLIFKDVKKLYDKRSHLVHTGDKSKINMEDLLKLRNYVRESIKKIDDIGKNKDELLDILNSSGFDRM